MRLIAHVSTQDKEGGAAIAAWRLHQGMQRLGEESRMVSRRRSWPGPDVSCISASLLDAADLFNQQRVRAAQPPGATLFSLAPTSISLLEHPWIAAADVVHLHWVARFLSPEDIEQLCQAGKTVFWTFHDQWPYTGGCHYIGGTRRLDEDWDGTAWIDASLHPLARMERLRKKRAFASSPIHVIAPSQWMAREAAASGLFAPERIHVVPYGLDLSVYSPAADGAPAEPEKTPEAEISLLFGCQNLMERRKGYQELREALLLCMADPRFAATVEEGRIRLKTFGRIPGGEMDLPIPVIHLGTLMEETQVAEVLRNASAFLCPTLDDNLPNVIMEALACGCPIVAFAAGGVPDLVTDGNNGLLAPQGDVTALARHLMDFCLDSDLRRRLRDGVRTMDLTDWTLEAQARHILGLYDAVSPRPPNANARRMPDCPPLLAVDARILPHFSTEMTRMFVEENTRRSQQETTRAEALRQKIQKTEELINQLRPQLEAEAATRKALQTKVGELKRKMGELQRKVAAKERKRRELQDKLRESKAEIQTLKQSQRRKMTVFHRVWRALRGGFKRNAC